MTNASWTGNWQWWRWTGISLALGYILILEMNTVCSLPPKILHSRTCGLPLSNIICVRFQRPLDGSMLCRSINGPAGFKANLDKARPEAVKEFKNSIGYGFSSTSGYPRSDPIRLNNFSLALSLIGFFLYGLPGQIFFVPGLSQDKWSWPRPSHWWYVTCH